MVFYILHTLAIPLFLQNGKSATEVLNDFNPIQDEENQKDPPPPGFPL